MCATGLSTMIGYIYAPQVWHCVCVCFVTLLYQDFVNFLNIFLYYIWSISFLNIFFLGAGVFSVRLYLSSVRWRKDIYSLNNSVSTFSYGVEFKARNVCVNHWDISFSQKGLAVSPFYKHIEAETKWPPFSRRHFQMIFLEWKCMNLD